MIMTCWQYVVMAYVVMLLRMGDDDLLVRLKELLLLQPVMAYIVLATC